MKNLQSWLDGKRHMSNSIMEYAKQRKPIPITIHANFIIFRNNILNILLKEIIG